MHKYFTVQGKNEMEALQKIWDQYGDKAKILNEKKVPIGGFLGLFAREGVEYSGYVIYNSGASQQERDNSTRQEILSRHGNGKETIEKEVSGAGETLQVLLDEVRGLKEQMGSHSVEEELSGGLQEAAALLRENEFGEEYIREMIDRMKREMSLDDLENTELVHQSLASWIGETVSIYRSKPTRLPRIFVLVGPTGVGKTTTIAKLAALNGVESPRNTEPLKVKIITIDCYRIGAREQISTYGNIMNIPVTSADNYDDLKREIDLAQDSDMILVDTIGKSPKDFMKLAEMRKLLEACGPGAEMHLAISATTKVKDLEQILIQFSSFNYESVVLTKLDETTRIGGIIDVLYRHKKAISHYTNGQGVPRDIELADLNGILDQIDNLSFNSDRLRIGGLQSGKGGY